jgi:hypothetical protein
MMSGTKKNREIYTAAKAKLKISKVRKKLTHRVLISRLFYNLTKSGSLK